MSTGVAALFGAHGWDYRAASGQVKAFHARLMQAPDVAAGAYAGAQAANGFPRQFSLTFEEFDDN